MSLHALSDYQRYGRQMILDGFGLEGQLKLQNSAVAVVGAGGLGCPALQYLAAAGVGKLAIIDHDIVEISNLQRQILHSDETLGLPKVDSARLAVKRLNPAIEVVAIQNALTSENAIPSLQGYDIVLDCTDNLPTRYLLSDTCVSLGIPLVSGAAQRYEGQLCVYNWKNEGPCYRCFFPRPPAAETVGTCSETGILGAVTGIIGNLQALEAIKLIANFSDMQAPPGLLLYSALSPTPFRSVKMRGRKPGCPGCDPAFHESSVIREQDYEQFCGGPSPNWIDRGLDNTKNSRITAKELAELLARDPNGIRVLDVRPRVEFGICHLSDSLNIPITEVVANPELYRSATDTYIVCRLGNDSQIAVEALKDRDSSNVLKDVIGGLRAWTQEVDSNFPLY